MRPVKFLIGLLLLPAAAILAGTLLDLLHGLGAEGAGALRAPAPVALGLGLALAGFCFLALPRPTLAYVIGHELTHAVCALLAGARVRGLRIGPDGGAVSVSRGSAWIALAPYVVPAATLGVLLARGAVALFFDVRPYVPLWIGLVGLTWGFHLCFTLAMLLRPQPDIRAHGRLFSWSFIAAANLLVALLILAAVAGIRPAELVRAAETRAATLARAALTLRGVLHRRQASSNVESLFNTCFTADSGREQRNDVPRDFQSMLLTWSDSTTPDTFSPSGTLTSNGYPLIRFVMGQRSDRPTLRLYDSGEMTSAGR